MCRYCAQSYPQTVEDVDSCFGSSTGPVTDAAAKSIHSFPQPPIHIHPQITPLIHTFQWMNSAAAPDPWNGEFCDSMPESGVGRRRKAPPNPGMKKPRARSAGHRPDGGPTGPTGVSGKA